MSQNQQKYDYEFMKPQYYQFIKEEYNKAERVLSDIVSILKSSFDKKYILKNEYIQKVIVMLRDIREIESEIKGIYFAAENDTLEQPYKGLQEIKENVNALKRYYNGVNLLIEWYNQFYPGTIKAADKDEDMANKCDDVKLTLKKIAAEISKMIQKSKNEINEINKASDPETHTQKTKDTLDLLQKKVDELEKDQVEVNGHIDNMKEARSLLTKQMKITDIAVIHRYFELLTLQEYYDAVECIEVHKQYLENGRTQKENSSASDGTTKNAGDNSNSQKNEKEKGSAESKSSDENTAKSKGSEAESDTTQGKESENIGGKNASGNNYSSNSKKFDGASVNYSKPDFYKCLDVRVYPIDCVNFIEPMEIV